MLVGLHFDKDLWLPVSREKSMGDSVERKGHAYCGFQKQSGPTDQYWSKWLNLVMSCQVVVPGQSVKP